VEWHLYGTDGALVAPTRTNSLLSVLIGEFSSHPSLCQLAGTKSSRRIHYCTVRVDVRNPGRQV
jgi:hypothetical protein